VSGALFDGRRSGRGLVPAAFILVVCGIFSGGCSRTWLYRVAPEDLPDTAKWIRGIALPRADRNVCGPQALAAALRHAGDPVAVNDLVNACSNPGAATLLELSLIARARGLQTKMVSGRAEALPAAIDSGRPLIVALEVTPFIHINDVLPLFRMKPRYHCFLVVGYDSATGAPLFATTGAALETTTRKALIRRWRATDFAGLLVAGKDSTLGLVGRR